MFSFVKKGTTWASKLGGILFLSCILPLIGYAGIDIIVLLPNPTGDDTLGEYMEIRNTGCDSIDLGGYRLFDASNKTYVFPSPTIVASHENIQLPYSTTKIALNNSGVESVTLTDSGGVVLDTYEYSGTQKDDIVIQVSSMDENCEIIPQGDTNTGNDTTENEIGDSGSTNTENTDTGTLNTEIPLDSGSTSTGTDLIIGDIPGTGSSETGSTAGTGGVTGEIASTGVVFPEIIPTVQQPTNALFSGGGFDCTGYDPCRINLTLDPIFTGAFLAKDYTCEVITDTGSMIDCNPRTLYFVASGSLSIRLTSKIDPSQSRTVSWQVYYKNVETEIVPSVFEKNRVISGSINSGVIFPDIIPTFQNYTNTTNSGDILICTTNPCRVNFTLDPVFTGTFLVREYTCEVIYGTGTYNSCNPPQFYLTGAGIIEINIIHRASGEKRTHIFEIIQDIPVLLAPSDPKNQIGNLKGDTTIPIIVLEYDGKVQSSHEILGEYEINCHTLTCAVNLTAEKSYDPDGGHIRFLWYYGANDIKTTKDPGERTYGPGNHEIWLRVIDATGNMAQIRYHIHVLGVPEKGEKLKEEKKSKVKQIKTESVSVKIKKKKKPKKITFFEAPNLVLQNSKFTEIQDGYICRTNTKTCSLNLSLSGSQKGIIYTWVYDNGDRIISQNPKSKSFTPGTHTIRVIAGYSENTPLWTREIQVEVIPVKKSKKVKKLKVSKIVQKSGSIMINNSTQNPPEEQKSSDDIPFVTLALIGGIVPILLLRRIFLH